MHYTYVYPYALKRARDYMYVYVHACSTDKHSTISQPHLVGIGYRVHSEAVASFLAHYWPPVLISLDSRPSRNWFMFLYLLYVQIYDMCLNQRLQR